MYSAQKRATVMQRPLALKMLGKTQLAGILKMLFVDQCPSDAVFRVLPPRIQAQFDSPAAFRKALQRQAKRYPAVLSASNCSDAAAMILANYAQRRSGADDTALDVSDDDGPEAEDDAAGMLVPSVTAGPDADVYSTLIRYCPTGRDRRVPIRGPNAKAVEFYRERDPLNPDIDIITARIRVLSDDAVRKIVARSVQPTRCSQLTRLRILILCLHLRRNFTRRLSSASALPSQWHQTSTRGRSSLGGHRVRWLLYLTPSCSRRG
jgi:hypothetical protein